VTKIYHVILTRSAQKSLLKIYQSLSAIGRRISRAIEQLKTNPHLGLKLKGTSEEVRRIRVGDYRIVYEVYEDTISILIVYIGPRGGAY